MVVLPIERTLLKAKPYRTPDLPSNPTLSDYGQHAMLAEIQAIRADRVRIAGQLARALAQGAASSVAQGAIQLSLLAPPDLDAEACDRQALDRMRREYLDTLPVDRALIDSIGQTARQEAIDSRAADQEATRSMRASCGMGYAGLQARSGTALRAAVGYEYRDTPAGHYPPTTDAPNATTVRADSLTRKVEAGLHSQADLDRRVALAARHDAQAIQESRKDLPWIVSASVAPGPSGTAHASGVDCTRARKAMARNAIRANERIARLKLRSA